MSVLIVAGLMLAVVLAVVIALVFSLGRTVRNMREKAREAGYSSLSAYLRAAPSSDEERRDAADLALKGLVICIAGLLFPPLVLLGLFPFFYGARKLLYATMGLGLVDDADQPGA